MADLQACYFCGTAEGVAEYDAVPDALDPGTARQRSVSLCDGCREKLTTVLEPVVAAAADDPPATAGDPPSPGTGGSGGGGAGGDGGADDDRSGGEPPARGGDGGEEAPADGEPPDAGHAGAAPADRPAAGSGGGPTGGADGDAGGGVPPAYRKVLRLLRNREFPVERAAAEALATGAYDLTRPEAREVLDRAVAEGELVEEDGQLRRP